MKRAFAITLVLVLALAAAMGSAGAGNTEDKGAQFTVELDNAFGIVKGADLKIAGVRAGQITDLRIDRQTKRALVDFTIDKAGFGSLRSDTFCETRPQSLIGEYFIDCLPGTSARQLPEGSLIPVSKTASTVPADLLNNIMRRPQRERLRIILNELGAGVGARAEDLNEAIRRAHPGLRETNRVLAVLARQNRILRDLVTDGDRVITELAGNKEDVSRWVKETRETAAASAERAADIQGSVNRLPQFLRELRPTMTALGRMAEAQSPTLVDLNASAKQLDRLFGNLEPFAKASQLNLRSLGKAARKGEPAVEAGLPLAEQLDSFSEKVPELAKNGRIIGEHLEDRNFAVEKDPRSPGGQGYTGFEALVSYFFDQAMAINVYDTNGYVLKVAIFESECSEYQSAETLKEHLAEDPKFAERCASWLGDDQAGITTPDYSLKPASRKRSGKREKSDSDDGDGDGAQGAEPAGESKPAAEKPAAPQPPIDLGQTLEDLLGTLPKVPGKPQVPAVPGRQASRDALLDFLFGS